MAANKSRIFIREIANRTVPNERWQINWISDPLPKSPHQPQHLVDAFLCPAIADGKTGRIWAGNGDTTRQVKVALGVGYLPLLHIGSTFQNGEHIDLAPDLISRINVKVSPTKSKHFSLNTKISRGIPSEIPRDAVMPSEFAIGRKAWANACERNCQVLALSDVRGIDPYYVMIPSIEVARFFYCNTSFFARSLFADGWESLLRRDYCDTSDLPNSITVAHTTVSGLSHKQVLHLGLMLSEPRMAEEVRKIFQAMQRTDVKSSVQPLTCRFPFDEETVIRAEAVRIVTGTALGERYFVTRLLECDRPIPFEQCKVNPQMHPGQGSNSDDMRLPRFEKSSKGAEPDNHDEESSAPFKGYSNKEEVQDQGQFSENSSPAKSSEEIEIEVEELRFPRLNDVPCSLTTKEHQKTRGTKSSKKILEAGTHMSTGTPSGNRPVVSANIKTEPNSVSSDPHIRLLLASVQYLRNVDYRVTECAPCFLAAFAPKPMRERSWTKIAKPEVADSDCNAYRSRVLVAIQIALKNMSCIVAEIERRPGEGFGLAAFYINATEDLSDFFANLANSVVRNRGWPTFDSVRCIYDLGEGCVVEGRKGHHAGDLQTGEQMAKKIQDCFLELKGGAGDS